MPKTVLITGGSRGSRAATARLAAVRGYAVGISYRTNRDAAEAILHAIEIEGGRAFAHRADVSVEADVVSLFEAVDDRFGHLTPQSTFMEHAESLDSRGYVPVPLR